MKFFKIKNLDANEEWSIEPKAVVAIVNTGMYTYLCLQGNFRFKVKETETQIRNLMLQAE